MGRVLARWRTTPSAGRILLYHHVRDAPDWIESVAPTTFEAHLDWLAGLGLAAASVRECVRRGFPPGLAALSFDDGYESAALACAELAARGWSATLFVVPAWVGEGRLGVLSWSELRGLAEVGIEIGAHGLRHERLCGSDVARMSEALVEARTRIEQRLGVAVTGLAYPEGLASGGARVAAGSAGFEYACTTVPGRNHAESDRFALLRNEIHGIDADLVAFRGKLAGSDDWMGAIRRIENAVRCRP